MHISASFWRLAWRSKKSMMDCNFEISFFHFGQAIFKQPNLLVFLSLTVICTVCYDYPTHDYEKENKEVESLLLLGIFFRIFFSILDMTIRQSISILNQPV